MSPKPNHYLPDPKARETCPNLKREQQEQRHKNVFVPFISIAALRGILSGNETLGDSHNDRLTLHGYSNAFKTFN